MRKITFKPRLPVKQVPDIPPEVAARRAFNDAVARHFQRREQLEQSEPYPYYVPRTGEQANSSSVPEPIITHLPQRTGKQHPLARSEFPARMTDREYVETVLGTFIPGCFTSTAKQSEPTPLAFDPPLSERMEKHFEQAEKKSPEPVKKPAKEDSSAKRAALAITISLFVGGLVLSLLAFGVVGDTQQTSNDRAIMGGILLIGSLLLISASVSGLVNINNA
jgi:hypothetical protein